MRKFLILFNKEIKNLITIQLILPLIIMVVLFSFIGSFVSEQVEKEQEPKKIAVVDYDDSILSNDVIESLKSGNFIIDKVSLSKEEALDYVKNNNISTLVVIPSGFQDNVNSFFQNEIEIYNICFLCGKPTNKEVKGLPICETCKAKIFQEEIVYAK